MEHVKGPINHWYGSNWKAYPCQGHKYGWKRAWFGQWQIRGTESGTERRGWDRGLWLVLCKF